MLMHALSDDVEIAAGADGTRVALRRRVAERRAGTTRAPGTAGWQLD
jgi:hypothetical protein